MILGLSSEGDGAEDKVEMAMSCAGWSHQKSLKTANENTHHEDGHLNRGRRSVMAGVLSGTDTLRHRADCQVMPVEKRPDTASAACFEWLSIRPQADE